MIGAVLMSDSDKDLGAYCLEIADVKKRLSDLLDDVERGVIVFDGVNGAESVTVRCPGDLWETGIGTVLVVDRQEFMHVASGYWLRSDTPWVTVSDGDLYVYALVHGIDLSCVHLPYRRSCSL